MACSLASPARGIVVDETLPEFLMRRNFSTKPGPSFSKTVRLHAAGGQASNLLVKLGHRRAALKTSLRPGEVGEANSWAVNERIPAPCSASNGSRNSRHVT